MQSYENNQYSIDIYDDIFILWHSIYINLSIHWHLEFRYSIALFLMCHYYILHVLLYVLLRSLLFLKRMRSLTFFIPNFHVCYIYGSDQSGLDTFIIWRHAVLMIQPINCFGGISRQIGKSTRILHFCLKHYFRMINIGIYKLVTCCKWSDVIGQIHPTSWQ